MERFSIRKEAALTGPQKVIFYPSSKLLETDYSCLFRDESREPYTALSYHDFYEFQVFLGSAGLININGDMYAVQRGDLAFIGMFTPHELHISKDQHYKRFSISLSASRLISMSTAQSNLPDLFRYTENHHPVVHIDEEAFAKYVRLLEHYQSARLDHGQDLLDLAVIHQLLAFAYNDCWTESATDSSDSHYMLMISQLINYINEHLSENLSLATLADQVSYSQYYVCRIFKKMTNKNLSSYILEKRIGEAARLLREGSAVSRAAEAVGFNNYSYFYKSFLRLNGTAPAEYRDRWANAEKH